MDSQSPWQLRTSKSGLQQARDVTKFQSNESLFMQKALAEPNSIGGCKETHQPPAATGSKAKGTPELIHIHMPPVLPLGNITRGKMGKGGNRSEIVSQSRTCCFFSTYSLPRSSKCCLTDSAGEQTPVWGKDDTPGQPQKAWKKPTQKTKMLNTTTQLTSGSDREIKQVKSKRKHTLTASAVQPALSMQQGSSACQVTGLDLADASSSQFWGNPHSLAAFRRPETAQSAHRSQVLLCLDPRKELLPFSAPWLPGSWSFWALLQMSLHADRHSMAG